MESKVDPAHLGFMKRALALAGRGAGRVSPNPLVGAVVVRGGKIVGEGYHIYSRRDHGEVVALREAGRKALGATLYLNLEPCVHHGRTPPCVERILEAGIAEVHISVRDPNPLVRGRGVRTLRRHGIRVEEGLCREEAIRLNEKFFHFIRTERPFVLLKLALTLDGRIATRRGDSKWITGEAARRRVHRLRYQYDAVLVGIETVLMDDPSLDVRGRRRNRITKVILDSRLRTPPSASLFRSGDPVVIFHSRGAAGGRARAMPPWVEVRRVSRTEDGLDWGAVLGELGQRGVTSLMIEGGGRAAASALKAGVVQRAAFFYGPKLVGAGGLPGVGDLGVDRLAEAVMLKHVRVRALPPDFLVEADVG